MDDGLEEFWRGLPPRLRRKLTKEWAEQERWQRTHSRIAEPFQSFMRRKRTGGAKRPRKT